MKYTIVDKNDNNIPKNKPWKNGVITKKWNMIQENDIFFFPMHTFSFQLKKKMRKMVPIKSKPNRTIEFYIISVYTVKFEVQRDKIFNKKFCSSLILKVKKELLNRLIKKYPMPLRLTCPVELNTNLLTMTDYDLYWYIEEQFSKCGTMNKVRKMYKTYARVWHPDTEHGDARVFSIITQCYEEF